MTIGGTLLLAGGGHSHSLLLKRWAMRPERRPKQNITLVNRSSTALYSGMVPGFIAGLYQRDELAIDLLQLCDRAGVAFIEAEITGLDIEQNYLLLRDRPALHFNWLSLDMGAVDDHNASISPIKVVARNTNSAEHNAQTEAALVLCHSGTSSCKSPNASSTSCAAIAEPKASSFGKSS